MMVVRGSRLGLLPCEDQLGLSQGILAGSCSDVVASLRDTQLAFRPQGLTAGSGGAQI